MRDGILRDHDPLNTVVSNRAQTTVQDVIETVASRIGIGAQHHCRHLVTCGALEIPLTCEDARVMALVAIEDRLKAELANLTPSQRATAANLRKF